MESVNSCSAADSGLPAQTVCAALWRISRAQLGGGSIVNKSPEKVDCSAVFGSRYVAKNIVAADWQQNCSVQLLMHIACSDRFQFISYLRYGTVPDEKIASAINTVFDLTPGGYDRIKFNLLNGEYI